MSTASTPRRSRSSPSRKGWAISADLRYALDRLPVHQREAVVLVGAAGMTIAEAASVCGCEPGTIKSRVSRGRARLADLLADDVDDGIEHDIEESDLLVSAREASFAPRAAMGHRRHAAKLA